MSTIISNTYNFLLLGDEGVGKRSYVNRLITGDMINNNGNTLELDTNEGKFFINFIFCSFDDICEIRQQDSINAVILMCDVTNRTSYKNLRQFHKQIDDNICIKQTPIVVVGNKVDSFCRVVNPKNINFHRKNNLQYIEISNRSCYNLYKPILYLLGKLNGIPRIGMYEEMTIAELEKEINKFNIHVDANPIFTNN